MTLVRTEKETDEQWTKRLEKYVEWLDKKNKQLAGLNEDLLKSTDIVNPRTQKKYKDEAQSLFYTVVTLEKMFRGGNLSQKDLDNTKSFLQEQLLNMNFTMVDICDDACLKPGAYNG